MAMGPRGGGASAADSGAPTVVPRGSGASAAGSGVSGAPVGDNRNVLGALTTAERLSN